MLMIAFPLAHLVLSSDIFFVGALLTPSFLGLLALNVQSTILMLDESIRSPCRVQAVWRLAMAFTLATLAFMPQIALAFRF